MSREEKAEVIHKAAKHYAKQIKEAKAKFVTNQFPPLSVRIQTIANSFSTFTIKSGSTLNLHDISLNEG